MSKKPYLEEQISDNVKIRKFSKELTDEELVWHRDYRKRKVEVLEGRGWEFQVDNYLPFRIKPGDHFFIEAFVFHRLLVGTTDLKIRITEII